MAATYGPALWPSTTTYPNTNVYPGQGTQPIVRCRLALDDYSNLSPAWQEVPSAQFRTFSSSRGRDDPRQEFDAGTASVTLDNRNRDYDSNTNAAIAPMNGAWLYWEFSGEVHDIFKGRADSWSQEWPTGGWSDAVSTVQATDEFKNLAMQTLPTTSPPRDSYEDLIGSDLPQGYWRMNEAVETRVQPPHIVPDPNPSHDPPPPPYTGGYWGHGRQW